MLSWYWLLESGVVTPGEKTPEYWCEKLMGPKYVGANGLSASVLVPLGNIPVLRTIDAGLPAKLRSEADRVKQRPREAFVDEVGIVEDVLAIRHVIVGGAIERGIGRIDRARQRAVAGIDVLIEFLEVGEIRPVLRRQSVFEIVVDEGHRGLHRGPRNVEIGAAEERGQVAIGGKRKRRIEARRCMAARRFGPAKDCRDRPCARRENIRS